MERLTERSEYNKTDISIKHEIPCSNYCTSCGRGDCDYIGAAIRRLAEYEDLKEQGLLLRLPCKAGERVYEIYRFLDEGAYEIDVHKIELEDLKKIGKTVFLTQEEAEKALKEREKENG